MTTPVWSYASSTSKRRGSNHYLWAGCKHAQPIGGSDPIEESLKSLTEARWLTEAHRLFVERTVGWTDDQRRRFGEPLGFWKPTPE